VAPNSFRDDRHCRAGRRGAA